MTKRNRNFWESFQYQQLLFDAHKSPAESLAQWAVRITKLGEKTSYEPRVLDRLLRDKFVTGLDAGPMQSYFASRGNLRHFTFKQILDVAFTKATQLDKERKARATKQFKY